MKFAICLFFSFYLVIFSASCKKDSDTNTLVINLAEPDLSATPLSIDASSSGDTTVLVIKSNIDWEIASSSLWCQPSANKGSDSSEVKIYISANNLDERSCSLIITSEGITYATITVSQEAFDYYIEPDDSEMDINLSAIEFSQYLGLGWNLGNSLESISVSNGVYSGGETLWGNPVVTKQLIDSVKSAGFNIVRIPVSWSHKILDESTYELSSTWLARVEQVVNYVLDNNMYAIINIHWDGGWMNHPDNTQKETINKKIDALWKQIAIYFRDYNNHLIFAGTNEVHVEGDWGTPSSVNLTVQKSFNQTFVDAVRATGGKNTYRFLVVQAYNTNIELAKNYLTMPTDITPNRLMAEVHYYDPYDFALQEDAGYKTGWGTGHTDVSSWGQEDWVNEAFGYMKTSFVDQGVPVILGEYGAILRSSLTGTTLENHVASRNYYLEYVTQAAVDNGIVPMYWDNGYTGNNGFGLFDRTNGQRIHIDAINALVNVSK